MKFLALVMTLLLPAGALFAHHSFSAAFDGTNAIQFKGIVTSLQIANPHIFIFLEVKGSGGKTELWALEGPSLYGFDRKGLKPNFLKKGDAIAVCGYATRPGVDPETIDSNTGRTGKKFSAEQLTLPGGEKLAWADYGTRKCLSPKK